VDSASSHPKNLKTITLNGKIIMADGTEMTRVILDVPYFISSLAGN
jgi:hypothetical protein